MTTDVDAESLIDMVRRGFPYDPDTQRLEIEELSSDGLTLRLAYHESHLRPGGTISGPAMMKLVDTAMWMATQAHYGLDAVAVTGALSIHFLRRPPAGDLLASVQLVRTGRTQAVGTVAIRGEDDTDPVTHATVTYAVVSDGAA